jgi:hypothetical protein
VNERLDVFLLGGRLGLDDDGWLLPPLLDRLEQRGVHARVICVSRGCIPQSDTRIIEIPSLGSRWLKQLTIRRLRIDGAFENAGLLHVLHEEMTEVALALVDACEIPYVQTVDDFSVLDRGLHLSRR